MILKLNIPDSMVDEFFAANKIIRIPTSIVEVAENEVMKFMQDTIEMHKTLIHKKAA